MYAKGSDETDPDKSAVGAQQVDALNKDLDMVSQLIGHRLRQGDIERVLTQLDERERASFTEKLVDILRKSTALLEVSKRVSDSLSLDVLLPRMVQIVSEFLHADRCTLFLHDKETNELYSRIAQGDVLQEIRFRADLGIAGSVFTTREPVIIHEAYADPRFNPEVDRKTGYLTRNILCAPMMSLSNECIGVAQVLNRLDGSFTDDDLSMLRSITEQAASAFLNAQLYEKIARAEAEEAQLLEVTNAISRELHLEPLLAKIMETVTTLLNADRSTLFLHDPRTSELWSRVAQGMGSAEIRFPCHLGIAGSVFTSGDTVNIPDAYADPRFNKEIDKKTGYKTESILCMPVTTKDGTSIGAIQVLNKKGGPFTITDERRLGAFCAQASIAIENAKLFDEVMRIKNYNESILQSMSDGVITVGEEGTIVTANRAALRLFRKEQHPTDLIGKPVPEFFHGKNTWIAQSIASVSRGGEPDIALDADLWLRQSEAADGIYEERRRAVASVNISSSPLKDAKGKPMGCMVHLEDITTEKRLRGTMARYMTKELADKLLEEGDAVLGGKMQVATVLFTDIRSFTSISERLGAQATVKMLNEYFSIMVDIIMDHGGILDKYIGDAIMAVYGAPFQGEEDADHAVQAAVDMLKALRVFNTERVSGGHEPVLMGVGVNTDGVLSGNIGSLKRMDYTVIGDGVNLASRLEGANKAYGTQVLVSDLTVRNLKGAYKLREVDRIQVKGKNEPVGVFEVLDHYDEQSFPRIDETLQRYGQSLDLYRQRDWRHALDAFEDLVRFNDKDRVAAMYWDRCRHFLQEPPPENWDGVWVMKSK